MLNTALLASLLLLLSSHLWACECVEENTSKITIAKSYKRAAVVFVGRVTQVEPIFFVKHIREKSRFSGQDTTYLVNSESVAQIRYRFTVSRLFKGQAGNSTVVITVRRNSCSTKFIAGNELLIYGYLSDSDASSEISPDYETNACWRNKHLRFVEPLEMQELQRLSALHSTAID